MTSKYGREGGAPEWAVRKATEALDPHRKSVRLAKEIGVKIGFGTDAGTPFNFHGNNAKEFMCLVEFGDLTTTDALYAATGIAGEALGTERKIGQISKGFIADIIMIQGDPISDISVLEKPDNIRKIMLAGRLVKGTEQA
jgi:imidazolonepropionase-like amidohydrolase